MNSGDRSNKCMHSCVTKSISIDIVKFIVIFSIGLATLKAVGLTIIDKYSQIEIKRRKIIGISAFIYILCLLNYQYWSAACASILSYPVYSNKYMKSS